MSAISASAHSPEPQTTLKTINAVVELHYEPVYALRDQHVFLLPLKLDIMCEVVLSGDLHELML